MSRTQEAARKYTLTRCVCSTRYTTVGGVTRGTPSARRLKKGEAYMGDGYIFTSRLTGDDYGVVQQHNDGSWSVREFVPGTADLYHYDLSEGKTRAEALLKY